jgi:hypothetical protein
VGVLQGKYGIASLREFERRPGNSPCQNSWTFKNSVDGHYAGMKPSLAQIDNTFFEGIER